MTEKRYSRMTNHYGTSRTYCTGVYDNQNNRELKNASQVITELNALHEENVKLQARNKYLATKIQRERNSYMKQHEKWEKEIKDENEELKQFKEDFIKMLDDITSAYVDLLNESWEENEQLKSDLRYWRTLAQSLAKKNNVGDFE